MKWGGQGERSHWVPLSGSWAFVAQPHSGSRSLLGRVWGALGCGRPLGPPEWVGARGCFSRPWSLSPPSGAHTPSPHSSPSVFAWPLTSRPRRVEGLAPFLAFLGITSSDRPPQPCGGQSACPCLRAPGRGRAWGRRRLRSAVCLAGPLAASGRWRRPGRRVALTPAARRRSSGTRMSSRPVTFYR